MAWRRHIGALWWFSEAYVAQGDPQPGVDVGPMSDFLYINLESEGYVYTGTKSLEAQYP